MQNMNRAQHSTNIDSKLCTLFAGQFGTTRMVTDKKTGQQLACKSISKRKLTTPEECADVKREVQVRCMAIMTLQALVFVKTATVGSGCRCSSASSVLPPCSRASVGVGRSVLLAPCRQPVHRQRRNGTCYRPVTNVGWPAVWQVATRVMPASRGHDA
jgi:hypothetical protein